MTAVQGPQVRESTGEVTVDGVVIGHVQMHRSAGAVGPLWTFSRMVLNRGQYVAGRGYFSSRADAVAQLMEHAGQISVAK